MHNRLVFADRALRLITAPDKERSINVIRESHPVERPGHRRGKLVGFSGWKVIGGRALAPETHPLPLRENLPLCYRHVRNRQFHLGRTASRVGG